jgi:glyoxylase-like metal-dependent hydrolase (beta-lactamase superfamily II)
MVNFETPASQVNRIRMQGENPPRGGGQQPVQGEQQQNQVIVVGPNTAWAQQLEIIMLPPAFLKAAGANNATVRQQTVGGRRYQVLSFVGQNKARVNGYINDQNIVEKVETRVDNPMYGDMLFESTYTDYKDFGGVKFPTRIIQRQGDHPTLDLTLTDVKPNAPVNIQAPQPQGGGGQAQASVTVEKLGEGVFLILGGYASLAIEMKDHIVVVEGGQSEARGLAVIAEAKKAIPNKPIRYIVNTHSHFDHSSGLRPFVAEGATIITHEISKDFLDRLFKLPRTLNPDKMAQANARAKFETVKDRKTLSDGNQVVELYRMTNMGHHDGLLMVYLPKLKVLLEADAYNPAAQPNAPVPATPSPYNLALVDNVRRLNLDVTRIIPVHYPGDNRQVTMSEVMRMIGRSSSNE